MVLFFARYTAFGLTKNLLSLPFQALVFFGMGYFQNQVTKTYISDLISTILPEFQKAIRQVKEEGGSKRD